MKTWCLILLAIGFAACSTQVLEGGKEQAKEQERRPSEFQEFALSGLPDWANFVEGGRCFRKTHISFFDLHKLSQSYGLSYAETIHFQHIYNVLVQEWVISKGLDAFTSKEELLLFAEVKEKVLAKNFIFKRPEFARIHLIWIDPFLENGPKKIEDLHSLMSSDEMKQGYPIFISVCLSYLDLRRFIEKENFTALGVKGVSAEMFSIFGDEEKRYPYYSLSIDALFNAPTQKLYFYLPSGPFPAIFRGSYIIKIIP